MTKRVEKMPLRVLVADDERLPRYALRALLEKLPGVAVVAECADGLAALEAIRRDGPDVAFLDIEMPKLDGLGVADRLGPASTPVVVFVTAYDEHAIRAFEVRAVDYVLKPFDERRLAAAIEHARTRLRERAAAERMDNALDRLDPQPSSSAGGVQRLLVRAAGRAYSWPRRRSTGSKRSGTTCTSMQATPCTRCAPASAIWNDG
jgi:two-component system LytT family response regulator